jgi:hypothetical protein
VPNGVDCNSNYSVSLVLWTFDIVMTVRLECRS